MVGHLKIGSFENENVNVGFLKIEMVNIDFVKIKNIITYAKPNILRSKHMNDFENIEHSFTKCSHTTPKYQPRFCDAKFIFCVISGPCK